MNGKTINFRKYLLFIYGIVAFILLGNHMAVANINLTLATAGTAGMYYPVGGSLASIWSDEIPGLSVNPSVTGGSIENTRLLDQGEVEIGLQANSVGFFAYKGLEQFAGKPITSIKSIANLIPEFVHIVVRENSGIETIKDLKSKKVSVGPKGSMEVINSRLILEACGLSYDEVNAQFISYAEATNQFKDRMLDCVIFATGLGTSAIQDIASTQKIRILSLSKAEVESIVSEYPFFVVNTIPANTYLNQKNDISTVTTQSTLVCRTDLDAEIVYQMTKTMFENLDRLSHAHAMAKYIKLETALDGLVMPIHPGAEKYYKEKQMIR